MMLNPFSSCAFSSRAVSQPTWDGRLYPANGFVTREHEALARVWSGFHRHPIWTVFVGLLIVFALVWNWNWFRPMVAKKIADESQRPVTLQHFEVENAFSAQPTLVLDGIAIGNPPDFPDGTQTGTVDDLRVSFDLRALVGSWARRSSSASSSSSILKAICALDPRAIRIGRSRSRRILPATRRRHALAR
jgi:hypothetical protein